jgi:PhoH-like ATPase
MNKKIYVLDTCVLLHDPKSIYKFHEHDIYIPLAVIDDLDNAKTREGPVGWSAREVFRHINKHKINDLIKGVEVNDEGGRVLIYNIHEPKNKDKVDIVHRNSDNELIEVCSLLQSENEKRKVILVSKDTGLRIRARSFGVETENYRNDMIDHDVFSGFDVIKSTKTVVDELHKKKSCTIDEARKIAKGIPDQIVPNQFLIFQNEARSCIMRVSRDMHFIKRPRCSTCGTKWSSRQR